MIEGAALYQVHDNGGRPFTVLIDELHPSGTRVRLYRTRKLSAVDEYGVKRDCDLAGYVASPPRASERLATWEGVSQVWVPRYANLYLSSYESLGNSLLLQIDRNLDSRTLLRPAPAEMPAATTRRSGHRYVFIGGNVGQFDTSEPISAFESPVGNNDVPYPVAISESEVFFPVEALRLPRASTCLAAERDPKASSPLWEKVYGDLFAAQSASDGPRPKKLLRYREIVARQC